MLRRKTTSKALARLARIREYAAKRKADMRFREWETATPERLELFCADLERYLYKNRERATLPHDLWLELHEQTTEFLADRRLSERHNFPVYDKTLYYTPVETPDNIDWIDNYTVKELRKALKSKIKNQYNNWLYSSDKATDTIKKILKLHSAEDVIQVCIVNKTSIRMEFPTCQQVYNIKI